MTDIMLRPDLKTTGGEVSDILWNDQFVGTMTLVYREADRISGAIQLEEESLPQDAKQRVMEFLQEHIQSQIHALGVHSCDVMVTYSHYDHVIATNASDSELHNVEEDLDYEFDWTDTERFEDDPLEQNEYAMNESPNFLPVGMSWDEEDSASEYYELMIVAESRNKAEYHIYDDLQELVAEASIRIVGREVSGTIIWMFEPDDNEIEAIADLVVSDFDEDEVDTFVLHMKWDQEIIETIELTHQDLFEDGVGDDEAEGLLGLESGVWNEEDYSIVLARDDGDTLTYEIYQQSYGGFPIGTATVDISERQLTGFIDFREPGNSDDREYIATLLMQELDKEKEFESLNITMLFQNKPFEELTFESDAYH